MKVGQGKVCRDDQGLSGAAPGVYDVENLFHGIGRVPFDAQVVNDKKVISGQLVQEFLFVFAEALKFVQDSGEVRHAGADLFVDQGVCYATGQKGLSGPDAAIKQNSDIVGLHFRPVFHIAAAHVGNSGVAIVVLGEVLGQVRRISDSVFAKSFALLPEFGGLFFGFTLATGF